MRTRVDNGPSDVLPNTNFQNIVYGEYVRDIVGPALVEEYSLDPGTSSVYQPDRNPAIINAFATAAFRFGHSQGRI